MPHSNKYFRRQVESIKRQKIVSKKVVSLADFRELRRAVETRNVLVVDDDEIMRNGLKRILEKQEFNVILAEDGHELSKVLETNRVDLILLDVNLPWVDGYELCRLIRGTPSLSAVPVVMVSARNSKEDVQKGFDAGCNDYVTKPFDIDAMHEVIAKMLDESA